MFDGLLENYTSTKYKIKLLEGAKVYYTKPYPTLRNFQHRS